MVAFKVFLQRFSGFLFSWACWMVVRLGLLGGFIRFVGVGV